MGSDQTEAPDELPPEMAAGRLDETTIAYANNYRDVDSPGVGTIGDEPRHWAIADPPLLDPRAARSSCLTERADTG